MLYTQEYEHSLLAVCVQAYASQTDSGLTRHAL